MTNESTAWEVETLENLYHVPKASGKEPIVVTVPGSKSITNRALLLAALSEGPCLLKGVLFSDDSRAVLSCLEELGFELEIREKEKEVRIVGTGGEDSKSKRTSECSQRRNGGTFPHGISCLRRRRLSDGRIQPEHAI